MGNIFDNYFIDNRIIVRIIVVMGTPALEIRYYA